MIEKNDTLRKIGPYGDERCICQAARVAAWNLDAVKFVLDNPLRVMGCSVWNNFAPWQGRSHPHPADAANGQNMNEYAQCQSCACR
jgi:hypothetical protein